MSVAPRWRRLLAFMLDGLLIGVVATGPALFWGQLAQPLGMWGHLLLVPVMTLYRGLFQGFFGGTPGQLLLGLRVVSADGGRLSLTTALLRGAILGLGLGTMGMTMPGNSWGEVGIRLLGGLFGAGSLYLALFEGSRRGLHDLVAGTLVVRRGQEPTVAPVARVHGVVVALLALVPTLASVPISQRSSIQSLQQQLSADPRLRDLQIWEESVESHGQTGGLLRVEAWWMGEPGEVGIWMEGVEKAVRDSKISGVEILTVELTSGWDVGFAAGTTHHERSVPLFAQEQKEGEKATPGPTETQELEKLKEL